MCGHANGFLVAVYHLTLIGRSMGSRPWWCSSSRRQLNVQATAGGQWVRRASVHHVPHWHPDVRGLHVVLDGRAGPSRHRGDVAVSGAVFNGHASQQVLYLCVSSGAAGAMALFVPFLLPCRPAACSSHDVMRVLLWQRLVQRPHVSHRGLHMASRTCVTCLCKDIIGHNCC